MKVLDLSILKGEHIAPFSNQVALYSKKGTHLFTFAGTIDEGSEAKAIKKALIWYALRHKWAAEKSEGDKAIYNRLKLEVLPIISGYAVGNMFTYVDLHVGFEGFVPPSGALVEKDKVAAHSAKWIDNAVFGTLKAFEKTATSITVDNLETELKALEKEVEAKAKENEAPKAKGKEAKAKA